MSQLTKKLATYTSTMLLAIASCSSHAFILKSDKNQSIKQKYTSPKNDDDFDAADTLMGINRTQGLMQQKQKEIEANYKAELTIRENRQLKNASPQASSLDIYGNQQDFLLWLNSSPFHRQQVEEYKNYLIRNLGIQNVPPMEQLLTTARSWQECGAAPFQVPPKTLWANMLPTLKLYVKLKQQQILPPNTIIRSVYRNPSLNQCAKGANNSKHLMNAAIDIWVPAFSYDNNLKYQIQDRLCQFWLSEGENHQFGLGLYQTGAIHLDTQGYRKWGSNHSSSSSPCRF